MPERRRSSPLTGVFRKPYHRDPLVYVAVVVSLAALLLKVVDHEEARLGWRLFDFVMAPVGGFVLVAVIGGFFRDPPTD